MPEPASHRSHLPLLGPGAELLRVLSEYSYDELCAEAESSGVTIRPGASHGEIANRLVRERYRLNTDELYAQQDNCFLNVDEYMPFLIRFIAAYRPRRVSELGCGTGILASMLPDVLPPDGVYLGSDFSSSGVVRARDKLAGDARFTFVVADAEEGPLVERTDCVLFPWVMNWLDTHAVERIWRRLAALRPAPLVIACVHLRGCVELRAGVIAGEAAQVAAAEQYLRGDQAAARAIWDTTRYDCYVQSFEEHFQILEDSVQPGAHIFWAARSREAPPRVVGAL
jgi:SAM-dependent methyltransferase